MSKQIQILQQKQSLTMTTSMHQSLSILQMSNIELAEFAAQELDKNPFIEDDSVSVEKPEDPKDSKDVNLNSPPPSNSNYSSQDYLANIASGKSLNDHILEQINIAFDDQKDKLIAGFLLDSLDGSGYLGITTHEVAKTLKCKEEIIEKILKTLQTLDPCGIFARDLKECLLIQLKTHKNIDPSILKMVQNIDLIASGDLKKLSKLCNANLEKVSSMIKQIQLLNPKPANGFYVEQTRYKIPDVILTFLEDGTAKLESNTETMPRLRVSQEYYVQIKDNIRSKKERDFTKNEIDAANIIVKSIHQRSHTILKVATAIVEEQIDFFTRGVMYLNPMTLNKIAALTGFNESTISRSTANKYMATPSGIFELKYFFSSSLGTTRASGGNISSTKAKEIIKQIILSEDSDNILSDEDVSDQLSKFNISIARRTVAKYREAIGIPTSSARKRHRNLSGA